MLVASGFLNWKDPFVVDEIGVGNGAEGVASDVLSTITHACDRWRTTKLRYLVIEHCERILEPTIVQRLTCLELELTSFDGRKALDRLLFHSPNLDLRLIFPHAEYGAPLIRMWREFMKSTVEPRLLAGDTHTFVRSLWIRVPFFLLDLVHVYANYCGMAESGGKLFRVYNVGLPERPLSIFYAWYTDQSHPTLEGQSMKYYFIMPGWQECDRSVPFNRTTACCRHDFADWFVPAPSPVPEGVGWGPDRWYNDPEYLEGAFYDYPL